LHIISGMSIVHEVTLAAHCGFRTLGLALITNKCLWDYNTTYEPVHEDVIRIGELKANELQELIFDFVGVIKANLI
jgi:purine-nucleoside phosphorylase